MSRQSVWVSQQRPVDELHAPQRDRGSTPKPGREGRRQVGAALQCVCGKDHLVKSHRCCPFI